MGTDPASAHWLGFSSPNFERTPWAVAAGAMFTNLNRSAICDFVSSLRGGVACEVTPQFTNGTQHLVIEVSFADNVQWIARLKIKRAETQNDNEGSVDQEVSVMRIVRKRTQIPVPEVYAWDSGSKNVFGAPYILMEALKGQQIIRTHALFQKFKAKILDQMTHILMELSTIQFETIGDIEHFDGESVTFGTPAFTSARDFYTYQLDQDLQKVDSIPIDEREVYILENERCRRLLNQIQLTDGPYPLTHWDFGIFNVLIDESGNIVGVIDWSGSGSYPWEVFSQFPEPLRITWPRRALYSDDRWKEIMEDQRYFEGALRKCEEQRNMAPVVSSLIGSESKLIAEAVLGIDTAWRKRWMVLVEGIELKTKEPSYTPGSITFEDAREM